MRTLLAIGLCCALAFTSACDSASSVTEPGTGTEGAVDSFAVNLYPTESAQQFHVGEMHFLENTGMRNALAQGAIRPDGAYMLWEGLGRYGGSGSGHNFYFFDWAGSQTQRKYIFPICESCYYTCTQPNGRFICFRADLASARSDSVYQVDYHGNIIGVSAAPDSAVLLSAFPLAGSGVILFADVAEAQISSSYIIKWDADGREQWRYRVQPGQHPTGLAADDGAFVVSLSGESGSTVLKLGPQGEVEWSKVWDGNPEVAVRDRIYVVTYGHISTLDGAGNVIWDSEETWGQGMGGHLLYLESNDTSAEFVLRDLSGDVYTMRTDRDGNVLSAYHWPFPVVESGCFAQSVMPNAGHALSFLTSCMSVQDNSGLYTGNFWSEIRVLK